ISMEALWCPFRIGYKYQKPEGGLFLRVGTMLSFKLKEFSSFPDYGSEIRVTPLEFGIGAGFTF
ncbi:hypothetical protein, partial [Arcobacter sp.]|uniref:hypothetical protein n=1 Tax=Arcobacter sp. TaxID=1872629 RepID=UPI003D137057